MKAVKIERGRKRGKSFDAPVVGGENNISNLESRGSGGAVRLDVGDNNSKVLREVQAVRQCGRDFLRHGADFDAMNVAVFPQAMVDEVDDARRNREPQTFAAASSRKDKSI